jgi:hypothetical protein
VVAVVLLLAVTIGVGLLVAVGALGDGGTEVGRSATLSSG